MGPSEVAALALARSDYVDASSAILALGDATGWEPALLREAMSEVLEQPPTPTTQRALRLLFYAYEEAIKRR